MAASPGIVRTRVCCMTAGDQVVWVKWVGFQIADAVARFLICVCRFRQRFLTECPECATWFRVSWGVEYD